MSSTFFGLNIAYSGLLASNAALNTTANNISNVHTEGYSRQMVDQQAALPIRTFQSYGCAGAGVDTLAIERIRDDFYDQKFWNNNTHIGEYSMKSYYMAEIEDYFYDSGTNAGFTSVFDQMMITGLEELMKDPGNGSAKTQFVGYASALSDYFKQVVGNLQNVQKDVNLEIKMRIDDINSMAAEIATLNEQINTIEMGGQKANELRDQRGVLLDRLSKIVDIDTAEYPVYDANDPERETGAHRFVVKIAGGQPLVDSNAFKKLECKAREDYEKMHQTDINGLYDIYWGDGSRFNLYNASMGGELRGLIELRDGCNGEYFHGTITDAQVAAYTDPDGVKHDTVTVEVKDSYLTDLNKSNLSDQGGVISFGNQEFYYDSWSYTASVNASGEATYSYTFVLSADTVKNARHVTSDRVGKEAAIGSSLNYEGIPYYMNQMNEWVRTFSEKFNDILKSGNQTDAYPEGTGVIMFAGNHPTDPDQYQFDDDTLRYDVFLRAVNAGDDAVYNGANFGGSVTVDVSDDTYYRLTAENFDILTAMRTDPSLMTNKFLSADGVEQNDLLESLKKMVDDKEEMSFRGSSCAEFLESIVSDVALGASNANTFKVSFQSVGEAIDTTRLSISGVDEDEEAVNLVKFQNAYNLASKMIQVFQEIYDRLILQTGV